MAIRNVIFDLDGTLVDSRAGIEFSAKTALRAVLPGQDWSSLRLPIGIPIRGLFAQLLGNPDQLTLDLLERQFRLSYDSRGWKQSLAYAGAEELLVGLTRGGIDCFVATNKPRHATLRILAHLRLNEFFREIVTPDSADRPFTSKESMLSHLMRSHGLNEAETVFVGDTRDDRSAADICGVAFVAATFGYGNPLSEPKGKRCLMIIARLNELADAFGVSHAQITTSPTSWNSIAPCLQQHAGGSL